MPMDFPNLDSLKQAAEVHRFRQPLADEPEEDYRRALADHVAPIDFVESQEIRTSRGWDRWNLGDTADLLTRSFDEPKRRKTIIIR
jgi:hypothetical protein